MNKKTWKLWLLASICFLFVGIMNIIYGQYERGSAFSFLGLCYIGLSIAYYKKDRKS